MNFIDSFGNIGAFTSSIVAIPFLIIALVIGGVAVNRQRKARVAARDWSTAVGQVVASGVQPYRSRSGNGYSTKYRAMVSYIYTVGGQQFASDRLAMGSPLGYGSPSVAEREVAKYPAGATVQVYYNPNNPSEAVLETRAQGSRVLWFMVILMLVILAASTFFTLNMGSIANLFMNR